MLCYLDLLMNGCKRRYMAIHTRRLDPCTTNANSRNTSQTFGYYCITWYVSLEVDIYGRTGRPHHYSPPHLLKSSSRMGLFSLYRLLSPLGLLYSSDGFHYSDSPHLSGCVRRLDCFRAANSFHLPVHIGISDIAQRFECRHMLRQL